MASIYKPTIAGGEKSVFYRIAYKDENGRRRTVAGYRDKAATEAKARDIERRVERIKAGLPVEQKERTQQPLADSIEMFLDDLARRGSPRTEVHNKECKRVLTKIRTATHWSSISNVKPDDFTKYLRGMAAAGRAPRTQNSHHAILNNFLNWCVTQGWLEANPIAHLPKAPVGRIGRRRLRRAYTVEEWRRLQSASTARAVIYAVAGLSGLRRSELQRLERRDIEPMRWKLRAEITKNGRAENLPMLPECWEIIKPLWEQDENPRRRIFDRMPHTTTLHADLERAKITRQDAEGRWVDFHSLRYFFCTILARKLPIQVVRALMRHGTISLTCDLYMDLGISDIADAAAALPRVLDTPQAKKKADEHGGVQSTDLSPARENKKHD